MNELTYELLFIGSEHDPRYADRRLLNIPRRGDVLEGNLKRTPLAGKKGSRLRGNHRARLAKNDLPEFIRKLNGELHICNWRDARVGDLTGQSGHFLIQKVLRAAESQVFNFQFWRVGLFGGAKGKMRLERKRCAWPLAAGPHHDDKRNRNCGRAH